MTALALLGLLPAAAQQCSGEICFGNRRLSPDQPGSFARVRGREIAMIFQDAAAALNPVFRVGHQIDDVIRQHLRLSRRLVRRRTHSMLAQVGFDDPQRVYRAYPHQLSGGMAQRVMIAMAMSCNPRLLIADEPTTALDVTVQSRILSLIAQLQARHGFALLLVSHDIGVVARLADEILVMRAGKMVEVGAARDLLANPKHAYTRRLVQSTPLPVLHEVAM